jgi:hypothetical protein
VVEDKKDELVGEPKKHPLRRVCDRAKHCMQVLSQHPISGEDENDVLEAQKLIYRMLYNLFLSL